MDDPDDYGDVFCHMSFKEAIEEDLLTDGQNIGAIKLYKWRVTYAQ